MLLEPLDRDSRVGEVLVGQTLGVLERVYEVQAVGERRLMSVPAVLVELCRRSSADVGLEKL